MLCGPLRVIVEWSKERETVRCRSPKSGTGAQGNRSNSGIEIMDFILKIRETI
jgi:hypothetical protein